MTIFWIENKLYNLKHFLQDHDLLIINEELYCALIMTSHGSVDDWDGVNSAGRD